jgi:hypothetical protein
MVLYSQAIEVHINVHIRITLGSSEVQFLTAIHKPRKSLEYKELARQLLASGQGPTGVQAYLAQKAIAENALPDAPSLSSVKRWKKAMPPAQKAAYAQVKWPESFGPNEDDLPLPWEAAAVVLELLKLAQLKPTARLARFYWYATLAMPGADSRHRAWVAAMLDAYAALGGMPESIARDLERWMAYQPWTDEGFNDYSVAVAVGDCDLWSFAFDHHPPGVEAWLRLQRVSLGEPPSNADLVARIDAIRGSDLFEAQQPEGEGNG